MNNQNLHIRTGCNTGSRIEWYLLNRVFAEERVASEGRAAVVVPGPGALGRVMGEVRRAMAVTIVRAQQVCLLERLAFLAPGAREAAKQRQTTLRLEDRRKKEAQAYFISFHRGRPLAWRRRVEPLYPDRI